MATDTKRIRKHINRHLSQSGKGAASQLAREAGISAGTLSKFRSGTYTGKSAAVADRLATVLASRDAAEAIASGRYKLCWLVNTRRGLRVIHRPETIEALRLLFPDMYVIQVWRGAEPSEIHFVGPEGR